MRLLGLPPFVSDCVDAEAKPFYRIVLMSGDFIQLIGEPWTGLESVDDELDSEFLAVNAWVVPGDHLAAELDVLVEIGVVIIFSFDVYVRGRSRKCFFLDFRHRGSKHFFETIDDTLWVVLVHDIVHLLENVTADFGDK